MKNITPNGSYDNYPISLSNQQVAKIPLTDAAADVLYYQCRDRGYLHAKAVDHVRKNGAREDWNPPDKDSPNITSFTHHRRADSLKHKGINEFRANQILSNGGNGKKKVSTGKNKYFEDKAAARTPPSSTHHTRSSAYKFRELVEYRKNPNVGQKASAKKLSSTPHSSADGHREQELKDAKRAQNSTSAQIGQLSKVEQDKVTISKFSAGVWELAQRLASHPEVLEKGPHHVPGVFKKTLQYIQYTGTAYIATRINGSRNVTFSVIPLVRDDQKALALALASKIEALVKKDLETIAEFRRAGVWDEAQVLAGEFETGGKKRIPGVRKKDNAYVAYHGAKIHIASYRITPWRDARTTLSLAIASRLYYEPTAEKIVSGAEGVRLELNTLLSEAK